ncbi:MAG: hypothetical protein SVY10_02415 [Thermodesulfobacteriota bacterium]|nr:hypothetical protein [Thermodesulfobacteriota bacterium]
MYKIDMVKREAEVFFADGSSLAGSFFVSPQSSSHSGSQLVSELLIDKNSYLPFELDGEETIILWRGSIVMVILEKNELNLQTPCLKQIIVRVCLISGGNLNGKVFTDLPESYTRLSDFLNHNDQFFHLEVDNKDHLINSRFVKMVEPGLSA